jgi:hypothetical protein
MKFKILLLNVFILIVSGALQSTWSADTMFTPSLGLTGQFDDNVSFSRGGEKDEDFLYRIQPAATYDYATEINKLKAEANFDYRNYIDNSDYNTLDFTVGLEGDSNFTELLTLFGDLNYIKDNTLESQLLETGRVQAREDRQRYDLRGGLYLNVTELIRVGGDYQYRQTEYDSEFTEDYDDYTASFLYNQQLRNQLDSLLFRGSYAYRDVRTDQTNTYRATLGWTRDFSKTFSITGSFGGRYTEQYTYDSNSVREKNETTGFVADVRFFKQTDAMRTELRYKRDQVYSAARGESEGGAREVDNFSLGFDRNLTLRLKAGIDLNLYLTRNLNKKKEEDSQFYEIRPTITYNLTEYHRLSLIYAFQYEYDDAEDEGEEDADRNRVTLNLTFNFPRKL